jgi:hypothetical protein
LKGASRLGNAKAKRIEMGRRRKHGLPEIIFTDVQSARQMLLSAAVQPFAHLAQFAGSPPMGYPFCHECQVAVRSGRNFFHGRCRTPAARRPGGNAKWRPLFRKVLSVSADAVVLQSEVLGIINVPRKEVASLAFGTNAVTPKAAADVAQIPAPTNPPTTGSLAGLANTNLDLSAAFRNLGANTNVVGQIREQLLAGNPEAATHPIPLVSCFSL